jgi:hypothetical protein
MSCRIQGWWAIDNDGDEEGDGDGDNGCRQLMAMVTKKVMATATRVACNKEGNSNGDKNNGNGDKGGRLATSTRAMAMVTATATRPACNEEGKAMGSKGDGDSIDGGGQRRE